MVTPYQVKFTKRSIIAQIAKERVKCDETASPPRPIFIRRTRKGRTNQGRTDCNTEWRDRVGFPTFQFTVVPDQSTYPRAIHLEDVQDPARGMIIYRHTYFVVTPIHDKHKLLFRNEYLNEKYLISLLSGPVNAVNLGGRCTLFYRDRQQYGLWNYQAQKYLELRKLYREDLPLFGIVVIQTTYY